MSTYLLRYCLTLGLILSPIILAEATGKANATADVNKSAEPAKKKSGLGPAETQKKPEKGSTGKKPAETKPAETKPSEVSDAEQTLVMHAEKESAKLTDAQSKKLLDLLNTGDDVAIDAIPSVGEVKAKAIKAARPFRSVVSLIRVEGIGEVTFDAIIKWTQDGMMTDLVAKKPGSKTSANPAAARKEVLKKPAKETSPAKPTPTPPAGKQS